MKQLLFAFAFLALGIQPAFSQEFERAAEISPSEFTLENADVPVSATLDFPAVEPKPRYGVVLKFNARIVAPTQSGWNPYMTFRLNGETLDRRTDAGSARLLRRGLTMETTGSAGNLPWWRTTSDGTALMTFFAPRGTEELDTRVKNSRSEGFNYWLDLSDRVQYKLLGADGRTESDAPNRLEIGFLLTRKMVEGKTLALDVAQIELLYLPNEQIAAMAGTKRKTLQASAPAARIDTDDFSLTVESTGGMEVRIGDSLFFFESLYSRPAQSAMKFNRLGAGSLEGWTPTIEQADDSTIRLQAEGENLRLERTLQLVENRIDVTDSLTTLSAADDATRWYVEMSLNEEALNRRLAGQKGADDAGTHAAANPTVFLADKSAAVGMVGEDTVTRSLLSLEAFDGGARFGSRALGLAAGKTVTLHWSIYPQKSCDYYDFINRVRRDWGVNRTIRGPMIFRVDPDLARFGCRAKIACVPPWHRYANGTQLSDEAFAEEVRKKIDDARRLFPGIQLLGMIETNLVPFDASDPVWAEYLPLTFGDRSHPKSRYGIFISDEATKMLDEALVKRGINLSDSILRNERGQAMVDSYYIYGKIPAVNLMVQPEMGNHRFETFLEQIDFLLDTCGFDGIYIDQFQPSVRDGFRDDRWDGYTVELAQDGTIARKRYSYLITGATAREAILRHITDRGKPVLTNGQPTSQEERDTGVLAFQEMENDPIDPLRFLDGKPPEFAWEVRSHLGCPIALGLRPVRFQPASEEPTLWPEIIVKGMITALRNGVLYYYYGTDMVPSGQEPAAGCYEIANLMFPFTPRELHEGWLYGEERLIAAVSGTYTVHGSGRPDVFRFDKRGVPVTENLPTVTGEPGKWQVEVALDDWNEIAIVVVKN